jgi:imidazolonepropionase
MAAGIAAMAETGAVGVLLPTTAYILRLAPPPARAMIDGGVIVALGSDFNPVALQISNLNLRAQNAHCTSMALVMNLACVTLRLNMNEALTAATLNAAGVPDPMF